MLAVYNTQAFFVYVEYVQPMCTVFGQCTWLHVWYCWNRDTRVWYYYTELHRNAKRDEKINMQLPVVMSVFYISKRTMNLQSSTITNTLTHPSAITKRPVRVLTYECFDRVQVYRELAKRVLVYYSVLSSFWVLQH